MGKKVIRVTQQRNSLYLQGIKPKYGAVELCLLRLDWTNAKSKFINSSCDDFAINHYTAGTVYLPNWEYQGPDSCILRPLLTYPFLTSINSFLRTSVYGNLVSFEHEISCRFMLLGILTLKF
jgi:hypothetical protein